MLLYCCDYIIFVFDDSFLTNDNYSLYNDRPLSSIRQRTITTTRKNDMRVVNNGMIVVESGRRRKRVKETKRKIKRLTIIHFSFNNFTHTLFLYQENNNEGLN